MKQDRHLVPVQPQLFNAFPCPQCGAEAPRALDVLFIGLQVVGQYQCDQCGLAFSRDLPIGFAIDHPLAYATKDRKILDPSGRAEKWIHYDVYKQPSSAPIKLERKVYREAKDIVIVNTLDFLYGHVLLKLLNAQYYIDNHKDLGVVLLLPRMFEWLVPDGVAEVWLVDQKLAQARAWHDKVDAFVREQLPRYGEVYMARGYGHPDLAHVDLERFTKVKPFPADEFLTRPPHITFIARQDRLWFATPLGHFMYRAWNRLGMKKSLGRWFVGAQSRMIERVMRRIRRELPKATFTVVGLDRAGGFEGLAEDLRTEKMDLATELKWCEAYAKSQLVVGVHGSNMLLPTGLAAGCVEILPYDRYCNMVQDVLVRYNDRMQLFFYRFVDEYASPADVARHVTTMFRYFHQYRQNKQVNAF